MFPKKGKELHRGHEDGFWASLIHDIVLRLLHRSEIRNGC